jgi:hypothetical protein
MYLSDILLSENDNKFSSNLLNEIEKNRKKIKDSRNTFNFYFEKGDYKNVYYNLNKHQCVEKVVPCVRNVSVINIYFFVNKIIDNLPNHNPLPLPKPLQTFSFFNKLLINKYNKLKIENEQLKQHLEDNNISLLVVPNIVEIDKIVVEDNIIEQPPILVSPLGVVRTVEPFIVDKIQYVKQLLPIKELVMVPVKVIQQKSILSSIIERVKIKSRSEKRVVKYYTHSDNYFNTFYYTY